MKATLRACDLFSGAGGSSTGLTHACAAVGQRLDLTAVNHWDRAIETHSANHPKARHVCHDLDNVNPRDLFAGQRLDLLIASPECTHHSAARGGKPCNDQSRSTAWHVVRWADALRPQFILVENVREFQSWSPLGSNNRPLKSKRGETFQAWLQAIRSLGYTVDHRLLNAADYGAATSRTRLFIIARRGRGAIPWPEPTHAKEPTAADLFGGGRSRWRAAREVIDWSLPCPSIFTRKKPLSDNTLARIEAGLRRFGGANAEPFIVPTNYGEREGQAPRTHSLDEPAPTVVGTVSHGLCRPFLVPYYGTGEGGDDTSDPMRTLTARDRLGLVAPDSVRVDIGFRMLQPHELAAAMGFPVGYHFAGNRGERVKQIGNAVSVENARALTAAILDAMAA